MKKKRSPFASEKPKRGPGRPKKEGRVKVSVRMPKELKEQFKKLVTFKGDVRQKEVLLNDLWVQALSSWWDEHGSGLLEKYRDKFFAKRR